MEITLEEYRNISKQSLLINHKNVLKHTTDKWALKKLSFKLLEEYKKNNCNFGFIINIFNILCEYKTLVFIDGEFDLKGFVTYQYNKEKKQLTIEYFQSFQKGYGRKIFDYFKDYIQKKYPECKYIFLEEIANNSNGFWEKMKFTTYSRGLLDFGYYKFDKN